ncbi:hypothetical protein BUALT_Bualt10G0120900 [Buddleja alternifolia]|uniref:Uncharacterized protein n=1 Tax=Buddleja alternifolia TaxID=168488 RepID=A0AAV6WYT1_9LAMI|nr:hypothetical protein BUALT_Bualt10G0120900 [Buddleja alternifolia]
MRKKLNMPANSNTKTATDVAVAATCTTTTTVILDKATNFQASTDLLALPPTFPFSHNDNFTLPRSIFEGCSSNYSSDNSLFRPFSLGMDEKYGVDNKGILMDECSSYDNNADLFSIFNNDTELRRMSQNY